MTLVSVDVGSAIQSLGNALDGLFTSDDERLNKKEALLRLSQEPQRLQMLVNLQEAKHASVFVSGWRPAVGWICVLALFYVSIVREFLLWGIAFAGAAVDAPPMLDTTTLMTLLFALLGFGGFRAYEKKEGVARS